MSSSNINLLICATLLTLSFHCAAQSSCLQWSSDDPGCEAGTFPPSECPQQDDSCYSLTVSGGFILERGCLSSLSEQEQRQCVDESDRSCRVCTEVGCNSERWNRCHQCKTSTNSKCAFHPNRVHFCRNFTSEDRCYAKVVESEVIRGCQSDLGDVERNPCDGNKYCLTCEGDSCNSDDQDVLKTVTRCVQCKEGDFRCIDGTASNSECDDREDKCYIKMWRNGELDRGCLKKLTPDEQNRCNDESDRSCYSCSGKACNHHRWLRCFHCSPEMNSTSCAEEQRNATLAYYCGSFDLDDKCYTKLVDFEVTRGCASDLGINVDPCEGIGDCVACSTDGCNSISEAYIKGTLKRGWTSRTKFVEKFNKNGY